MVKTWEIKACLEERKFASIMDYYNGLGLDVFNKTCYDGAILKRILYQIILAVEHLNVKRGFLHRNLSTDHIYLNIDEKGNYIAKLGHFN